MGAAGGMHRTAGGMLRVAGEVHGAVERWQVAPWSPQTARDTSARRGIATRGAPVRVGRARGPTARRVHGPSGRLRCGRGGRARKASGCYKGPGGVQRGRKAVPPWCAERAFYPEAALRLDVTHLPPLACASPPSSLIREIRSLVVTPLASCVRRNWCSSTPCTASERMSSLEAPPPPPTPPTPPPAGAERTSAVRIEPELSTMSMWCARKADLPGTSGRSRGSSHLSRARTSAWG